MMTIKDIKEEARKKLALNMHQAVIVYTVEFTLMITLIALIVMSCVGLQTVLPAAIVMLCYGIVLAFIAMVGIGMFNFCMVDYYLATYRCKPYNVRRLGETLARSNVTKIFLLSLRRTLFSFLLLLCLIVPGVIYIIRTSMANYLLIANPKMSAKTALSASNKVMSGKTGSYFTLCMSLIGWYLLGVLTLGFGFIFILPYTNLIKAVYYKRNLQGDKGVYVVPPQPVSPVDVPPQQATTQQSVVVENRAAQVVDAQPQQQEPERVIMPIDTLADDDVRSMGDTMSEFGNNNNRQGQADIPEVPIMPVKSGKTKTHVSVQVEPVGGNKVISKSIDGTNIVESERMLTPEELADNAESQQQAMDFIYNRSATKPVVRDYFSGDMVQSPDDFVPGGMNNDEPVVQQSAADSTNSSFADSAVISDADFDEFLREFDRESIEVEEAHEQSAPTRGTDRSSRFTPRDSGARSASDRRSSGTASDRTARRSSMRSERSNERNKEIQDRAERLKREREERMGRNKK